MHRRTNKPPSDPRSASALEPASGWDHHQVRHENHPYSPAVQTMQRRILILGLVACLGISRPRGPGAAQRRPDRRRRPGLGRPRLLRQQVPPDAAPRPARRRGPCGSRRPTRPARSARRPGRRIMTGKYPARLHLTDWLPGRPDRPAQKLLRPGDPAGPAAGGNHARRGAQGGRLRHGPHRQVAPGRRGVRADAAGVRPEHRRRRTPARR